MSNIYKAILAVQQSAPFIDKSEANPFFKSKYADLPQIWRSIKEIMGANGLLVIHTMEANGDDYIVTKIIHAESGESIESKSRIHLTKVSAQEYGSYITYMRRYALSAMLGLVTDEDDDGNAASKNTPLKSKVVEKKDAIKPVTEEEILLLETGLKNSRDLDELKSAFDNFTAASKRMNDTQKKTLTDIKNKRKEQILREMAEAPSEAAE